MPSLRPESHVKSTSIKKYSPFKSEMKFRVMEMIRWGGIATIHIRFNLADNLIIESP